MVAPSIHFLVPGSLDRRTGGTIYDRRIIAELCRDGDAVVVHELTGRFPLTNGETRESAAAALAAIPKDATVIVDGLAMPALADDFPGRCGFNGRLVALCHHPLAAETGLSDAERAHLFTIERAGLAAADRIIVPSRHTAAALADYGVAPDRVRVVHPGLDPVPEGLESRARARPESPVRLLCVANLIPRKGHDVLLEAVGRLQGMAWTLTCIGSPDMEPAPAAVIHQGGRRFGGRVRFPGALSDADVAAAYADADVFVLASRHEGYGMVLVEAMQRGLPVVATTAGAIPEVVPCDTGLLVPPDDPISLAAALRRITCEEGLYRRLSDGAARHADSLADWATAARLFRAALADND